MVVDVQEFRMFGPPGTGKTTQISAYVKDAVMKHGSANIMVASFTKAAALELTGRHLPVDYNHVGTLHALCYRQLNSPRITDTLIDEWNKETPQFALSGGSADLEDAAMSGQFTSQGDGLYMAMGRLRAMLIPKSHWPISVQAFATKWDQFKADTDSIDFTDMIEISYRDYPVAPGNPSVGFFDEVQDFTPLELGLVRKWGSKMQFIILAGDDDQNLYLFKGSTPDAFLDPPVDDAHKRVLKQSYRVPRVVQAHAQHWIEKVTRREPKEYKPRDADGELRYLMSASFKNPRVLIQDVEQQLVAGKSVMILGSCSYILQPTIHALREAAIPFHNPYRRKRGDWNPLAASRGVSATERLLAFLRPEGDVWGDISRGWTGQDFKQFMSMLKADGLLKRGGKTQLSTWADQFEVTLDQIMDVFESSEIGPMVGGGLDWFDDHLLATKRKAIDFPLAIAKKYGGRILRIPPKVVVGTIHSVKGGEADVVYLFPDISLSGAKEWVMGGVHKDAIIRQYYVGITRAREALVITAAASPYNMGRIK